jgi:hypothetical protein
LWRLYSSRLGLFRKSCHDNINRFFDAQIKPVGKEPYVARKTAIARP